MVGWATPAVHLHLLAFSAPNNSIDPDNVKNSKSPVPRKFQNKFLFVPYGESAPKQNAGKIPHQKMISCDGKVPGTHLDLTHWTDNTTPDDLYADTSTEIALNFASSRLSSDGSSDNYSEYNNALVCNNHYDTDGVLSIWSCLHPTMALEYRDLLVSAAEAGDFGEWTSDEGLMIDCALESILYESEDEALAYSSALEVLPSLLSDLLNHKNGDSNNLEGGNDVSSRHGSLWREGFDAANDDWDAVQSGRVVVSKAKAGRVAFVMEEGKGSRQRLGSYALYRALHNLGLAGGQPGAVTRVLRATPEEGVEEGSKRWKYQYEMPGHGWVKRLVSRENVPQMDGDKLSLHLNEMFPESRWVSGGSSGLVSICRTAEPTVIEPETLVEALIDLDPGSR